MPNFRGGVQLAPPERHWHCPACGFTDVTPGGGPPGSRMHPCPAVNGLTTPMLPAGVAGEVRAVQREDYIGQDIAQTDDDGRPFMAVVVTRDDGQDVAVLAPLVTSNSD